MLNGILEFKFDVAFDFKIIILMRETSSHYVCVSISNSSNRLELNSKLNLTRKSQDTLYCNTISLHTYNVHVDLRILAHATLNSDDGKDETN